MSRLATTITLTLVVTLTVVHHALSMNVNNECHCGIENKVDHEIENKVIRRIIGGKKVAAGKYSWLVSVYNEAIKELCTGAIINNKFVLLASHCVDDANRDQMKVYHDQKHSNLYSIWNGTPLKVTNVFKKKHELTKDDIALLELEDKLEFNKNFSPICLTPVIEHDNYFAAGWGVQEASKVVAGRWDLLNKNVDLSEIPLTHIRTKFKLDYQIIVQGQKEGPNNEIKSNLCAGDSGAPLMTRKDDRVYTLGIASRSDCSSKFSFKMTVFEKIIPHKKWIEEHTRNAVWCRGSSHFFD